MYNRNKWLPVAGLVALLAISVWFLNTGFAGNEQLYFKTDKGLFYLKQVFETISRDYVDEVDPEELSKSAIKGIVRELDPYTVFFEKKGSERLEMITRGKYGGLGMEISKRDGKVTVISPIDNTPAQRAGIRAGDAITKINGEPTKELSLDKASSKLRGKAGTQVTLEIERPGFDKPITLTLTREEIVLKDVTYADFVAPGTAFIRLTSFSNKAASELKQAIRDLQQKGKIESVVLDLRRNPGGLLQSAVEVANVFIPKGNLIVQTRGFHEQENKFMTSEKALLPDVPLVVLVDGGSASASEIVAGAIQDLDRGVVLGESTFGKGLVQQVHPIDKINDAYLKITTAKYYVPSGRCIQKEDYKKDKKVFTDASDTTDFDNHIKYHTQNGRLVYGGGGIQPDITVKREKIDKYLMTLWAGGHLFRFTVDYLASHPELKLHNQLRVSDEILEAFHEFLKRKELNFEIEGEPELKKFLKIASEQKYSDDVQDLVKVALQKLDMEKSTAFEHHKDKIREALEAEFAEKIGGSKARTATNLRNDNFLSAALKVLNNQQKYNQILAIKE